MGIIEALGIGLIATVLFCPFYWGVVAFTFYGFCRYCEDFGRMTRNERLWKGTLVAGLTLALSAVFFQVFGSPPNKIEVVISLVITGAAFMVLMQTAWDIVVAALPIALFSAAVRGRL